MKQLPTYEGPLDLTCDTSLIYEPYTNINAQTAVFIKRFGLDARLFEPREPSIKEQLVGQKRSFEEKKQFEEESKEQVISPYVVNVSK